MPFAKQSLANKFGEVGFRKKLIVQHSDQQIVESGEPTFAENFSEIQKRVELCRRVFSNLQNQGITLSPFLEIAGGQGYRSDLLTNEYKAQGFSTDISLETLASHRIIAKKLRFNNLSIKVCCDAYNLPFLSNSFPFVFVALSLHHFPHPLPIIKEAVRILESGGTFYFDQEPIKQTFNLNLWRRDYHLRWYEKILKATIILLFLSRIGKAEVDHGILEETFSLKTWEEALSPFATATVEEKVFPYFPGWKTTRTKTGSKNWIYPPLLFRLGLALFGGGISGICGLKKKKKIHLRHKSTHFFGCPNCRVKNSLIPLLWKNVQLLCPRCKTTYKKRKGVYLLMEKPLAYKLYGQKD